MFKLQPTWWYVMGWLSSIKKAIKKVVRAVKTIIRVVVIIVIGVVMRIINTLGAWIPVDKKMRLQVFILRNEAGNAVDQIADVEMAFSQADATFKQRFGVNIKAYGKPMVQVLKVPAPVPRLMFPVMVAPGWKNSVKRGNILLTTSPGGMPYRFRSRFLFLSSLSGRWMEKSVAPYRLRIMLCCLQPAWIATRPWRMNWHTPVC